MLLKVKVKLLIFILIILWSYEPLHASYQTYNTGWLKREGYPYGFMGRKVKVTILVFKSALSTQYFMNHLLDDYQSWYSGCH